MKALPQLTLVTTLLFAAAAYSQAPAGSPEADEGSAPSGQGTPTPQQEMETHMEDGEVRIEDGRPVNSNDGDARNEGKRDDAGEHSSPGGPTDPASDPGTLD
ncbi:hypothetical protein [Pseudomonas subflava]|uniref:hypothetical protein n=1 Tax=Pseudomonas subflava TaxID=2952933 RepID=UPI00207AFB5C|nr:hypothetical protein [Pseudomonas subflava]